LRRFGLNIVPVLALVASYLAIAGERESGTLKLLLGMPPTRREVVLGKLLGRLAVTTTAIVVAFTVGALLAVVMGI
jgi:ABC-2 type transport system permease protein